MSEQIESTKYLQDLRRGMLKSFDQKELKVIAFDLSVNWEDLSGDTNKTTAKMENEAIIFPHKST